LPVTAFGIRSRNSIPAAVLVSGQPLPDERDEVVLRHDPAWSQADERLDALAATRRHDATLASIQD